MDHFKATSPDGVQVVSLSGTKMFSTRKNPDIAQGQLQSFAVAAVLSLLVPV